MHVKYLAGIVGAALLMAGCSSSNELSSAGQSVRFVEDKPGAECQPVSKATGFLASTAKRAAQCVAQQTICVTRLRQWAVM